jgi:CRISPR/Cas system-associated endonuclease Cas1
MTAFISLFAPEGRGDARRTALKVRERQFRAAFDPGKSLGIARAIVAAKIKAENHEPPIKQNFLVGLQKAKTTNDVRHVEAQTAQVWWQQWAGFEIRFTGAGVPAEWGSWPGR